MMLERSGVADTVGRERLFMSVEAAVKLSVPLMPLKLIMHGSCFR